MFARPRARPVALETPPLSRYQRLPALEPKHRVLCDAITRVAIALFCDGDRNLPLERPANRLADLHEHLSS